MFRCQNCRYPPCGRCRKPMPRGGSKEEFDRGGKVEWICGDCLKLEELANQKFPCCVCGPQPRYAFADTALAHLKNDRNIRCIDCSHPACSRPGCKTCTKCRSVRCRKDDLCSNYVHPLQAKQQPKNLEEKRRFRCESCRYPPCEVCRKPMPIGSRQRFTKSGNAEWTCGDCLTLEENRKVQAANRSEELLECMKCKKMLSAGRFSKSRWQHRRTQQAECLTCENTHPCSKCSSEVHRNECTDSQWEHRSQKLLCKSCQ